MVSVIAEPCIASNDTASVDASSVDCIHPRKNSSYQDGCANIDEVTQLYIDRVACMDCDALAPVWPVSTILAMDDLPEKWSSTQK